MSVLTNLLRAQQAHRQQPLLTSEADLVAEYDAIRRAYIAAMACNNTESALLWSDRANGIAREIARMHGCITGAEDEAPTREHGSA